MHHKEAREVIYVIDRASLQWLNDACSMLHGFCTRLYCHRAPSPIYPSIYLSMSCLPRRTHTHIQVKHIHKSLLSRLLWPLLIVYGIYIYLLCIQSRECLQIEVANLHTASHSRLLINSHCKFTSQLPTSKVNNVWQLSWLNDPRKV